MRDPITIGPLRASASRGQVPGRGRTFAGGDGARVCVEGCADAGTASRDLGVMFSAALVLER